MFKKLLLTISFFTLVSLLIPQASFAQDQYSVTHGVVDGMLFALIGPQRRAGNSSGDPMNLTGWMTGQWSEETFQTSTGAVHLAASSVGYLLDNPPPVRTGYFLADVAQRLNLAPPVYAQQVGLGFAGLNFILPIWRVFRNIAYFLFAIIFVVVGFMIMFRTRIDPQTVVNIQNALPRLIITLLLITFSYAIAALFIDAMFVAIYLSGSLLDPSRNLLSSILNQNIFGIGLGLITGQSSFQNYATIAGQAIGNVVGGIIGDFSIASVRVADLIRDVFTLIIGVVILFSLFRIFLTLLMTYVTFIALVIFSPIQLLFNAVPGTNAFFGWAKSLFGHLAVFPVVTIMLLIAERIVTSASPGTIGFVPPLIFGGNVVDVSTLTAFVALGFILMLPKAADITKKAIGVDAGLLTAAAAFAGGAIGTRAGTVVTAPVAITMTPFRLATGYAGLGAAASQYGIQKLPFLRPPIPVEEHLEKMTKDIEAIARRTGVEPEKPT